MQRRILLLTLAGLGLMAQTPSITADEAHAMVQKDQKLLFLDVRNADEIARNGSLKGYVNIPVDQLEGRLNEVPKDRKIITTCQAGKRAARAAEILTKAGYTVLASCGMRGFTKKDQLVFPAAKK
jgi:rhodanese-related sulfurtransferase